ncbi:MAG TPA: GNAT family N-acetyltransferase [Desulfosporosinus sp.]|nr:GNAT family N-acetyltransferase [Desulfosporosinus sp.]
MIRKATLEDLEDIMEIIKQTIVEMNAYDNYQWDENYPQEEDFIRDIQKEELFVIERKRKIAGFVCINKVEPVEYNGLNWTVDEAAVVLHRMSVYTAYRRSGIGMELMRFADEVALKNNLKYIKTDTYSINKNMNALFVKCGYNLVGEIRFLGKEKTFYCYEKVIN